MQYDRTSFAEGPLRCYYCGEVANTEDHVIPRSMLKMLTDLEDDGVRALLARHGRRMTVPACLECNVLLSNEYFSTLEQRKLYLKERLRRRYKKLLRIPTWTDTELSHMEDNLRNYVIHAIVKADIIRRRLSF